MTTLLPPAIAGLVLALALVMTPGLPATLAAQSGAVSPAAELRIGGSVETPLVLSAADLRKMPRKTLKVVNPHEKKSEVYEGVALEELLRRAGAVQGERLRGPALAMYVLAEACDGYRVVFSLAELDSAIVDSDIIVADTVDGGPLGPNQGPFRIVAPHDKRPARWVACSNLSPWSKSQTDRAQRSLCCRGSSGPGYRNAPCWYNNWENAVW